MFTNVHLHGHIESGCSSTMCKGTGVSKDHGKGIVTKRREIDKAEDRESQS